MTSVPLPVLLPDVPDQRWDCHACTRCCREWIVVLLDSDRAKIDAQGWAQDLERPPYVRFQGKWILNKTEQGACIFLQDDGKCRIHAEFGPDAKPVACRLYPFNFTASGGRWLTALRFDCPSMIHSKGRPLSEQRKTLNKVRHELPQPPPRHEEKLFLARGRSATPREVDSLIARLDTWLRDDSHTTTHRLIGAASLTQTLLSANLKNLRDDRFIELLELLVPELTTLTTSQPTDSPSLRQHALFRQLTFAYTEHATLTEIQSRRAKLTRRVGQLIAAHKYRRGTGPVPPLPGRDAATTFEAVQAVKPATNDAAEIESIISRFVRMRLLSRHQFGSRHFGWPVLEGLRALWTGAAVIGWLSRFFAAARQADRVTTDDVCRAFDYVAGAIGRAPALGTTSERLRLRFLAANDGIPRLLHAYRLTTPPSGHEA